MAKHKPICHIKVFSVEKLDLFVTLLDLHGGDDRVFLWLNLLREPIVKVLAKVDLDGEVVLRRGVQRAGGAVGAGFDGQIAR